MFPPSLEIRFDEQAAFMSEVERNLAKGRTFVAGASGLAVRDRCDLIVRHPQTGQGLRMAAEVVWVASEEPGRGLGFELHDLDLDRLRSFALSGEGDADLALPPGIVPLEPESAGDAAELEPEFEADSEGEGAIEPEPGLEGRLSSRPPGSRHGQDHDTRHLHERVRRLSLREQIAMARSGNLSERIALERCYGASVWEHLLQNPQLTPPEVSRIAKKGNLPQPLIGVICANNTWVRSPEVQRALLANPRLDGTQLVKVLKALSRADLQRVPQQTAYRFAVRDAAKRMLKG